MNDGSRHFASLPECMPWNILRDHLATLEGATVTRFLTDGVTEVWIDFEYSEQQFSINNQLGEYWFFVKDPSCDAVILERVVMHCSGLLRH